jgi:H+/Cl- antiporter ClcA
MYTEEQLMARLKFFICVCLSLTLTGIVFFVLYSLIFVTQPLNAISPIDQKFFELIVPIATFLTGTLSGIMLAGGNKEENEAKLAMMKQAQDNASSAAKNTVEFAKTQAEPAKTSGGMGMGMEPSFNFYNVEAPMPTGRVIMGYGGKPAPAPAPQPEL